MALDLAATMRETALAFVHAFDGDWAPNATLSLRAAGCEHTMLPSTLGIVGKKTNTEWATRYEKVAPLVKDGKMTVDDYVAVPAERRAVCRSSLSASTPVGLYSNEYVWFFTFDESGEKVMSIVEFLDGTAANDLLRQLKAAGYLQAH